MSDRSETSASTRAKKPKAKYQGKVVVDVCYGGFFGMLPDGQVFERQTKAEVEKLAKAWFKKHAPRNTIGVGKIEWNFRKDTVITEVGR